MIIFLTKFLDFLAALLIGIGIFYVPRNYRYWIVYLFGCMAFIVLFIITKLYISMILEIILAIVSLKNYYEAKKKLNPIIKGKIIASCGHELKDVESGISVIEEDEFKDGTLCKKYSIVCPKCYIKGLKNKKWLN